MAILSLKPSGKTNDTYTFIFNIFIHMIILFSVLSLVYFLIIRKISEEHFKDQFSANINNIVIPQLEKLSFEDKQKLATLNALNSKNFEAYLQNPKNYVDEHNWWIKFSCITIPIVLIISLILFYYIINYTCGIDIPIWSLLAENIITFCFVGVAEALFFFGVASKYIPGKPSLLATTMVDTFRESLQPSSS